MQVTSDTTLVKLHRILQRVMGWEGSHLYQFVIGGVAYGDPGLLGELEAEDARLVTLETIVRGEQFKFLYEYDFEIAGNTSCASKRRCHWKRGSAPVCLTGKRACPPEDCGGIWGYASFLEAIQDPTHPEHEEMVEWVGREFDPDAFDLAGVSTELQRLA